MLDFNNAFSPGAEYQKRKQKTAAKKMLSERAMAGCQGKVSFGSFTEASRIAGKRRSEVRHRRKPYRCHYCRKYHLA
jgi:hypothetical protein